MTREQEDWERTGRGAVSVCDGTLGWPEVEEESDTGADRLGWPEDSGTETETSEADDG